MGLLDFLRPRKVDANEIADVARDDWSPPPLSASSPAVASWGDWLEEADVELEEIEECAIDPELAELAKRARRPMTGPLPRAEAMAAMASAAKPPPPPADVTRAPAAPLTRAPAASLARPLISSKPKPAVAAAPVAVVKPSKPDADDGLDIPAYLMHLTPEERDIIRAQQDSAAHEALTRASRVRPRASRPRLRSTLGVRKGRERTAVAAAPIVAASSIREHLTEEELAIIAAQQAK
ncbi:MAG: hypothetical protein KC503_15625 [Myxococcales bacterium]|nr:hypothetical protein [Myxococcales bacterium]